METDKDRIEKVMEIEGLNAAQFAAEIDIKAPTLSHILNGRNNPSLDVLKKILERYPTISSDWLILGVGPMQRGIKHSQTPSLFDEMDDSASKSDRYIPKTAEKSEARETVNRTKNEQIPAESVKVEQIPVVVPKNIKKIIVYYEDNTFQEFVTK